MYMNKKNNRFFVAICLALCVTAANAQSVFQKHFSEVTEYQKLANSTFDSSYVIGSSTRDKDGLYDFSAVKLDRQGKIIWSKTFPSTNDDFLTLLYVATSGDILLGGYKLNSNGNFDFSLMKIDPTGKLQWHKTYGTDGVDIPLCAGITPLGDIYLVGSAEKDKVSRAWILKLSSMGSVLWSKMFAFGVVNAATLTSDGGVAVIGHTHIMKLNSSGTVEWANSNYFDIEGISTLKQTRDSGFAFCGKIKYCTSVMCSQSFAFIRIDKNGKLLWSKNFKGFGQGKDVIETSDNGFAFAGQFNDDAIGYKLVVVKTDNKGVILWSKSYGNADSNGEYANIVTATGDRFLLLGVEDSKALLILADANGNTSCNAKELSPIFQVGGTSSSTATINEKNEANTELAFAATTESFIVLRDSLLCNSETNVNDFAHSTLCRIFPSPFKEQFVLEILGFKAEGNYFDFIMYDVFGRIVKKLSFNDNKLLVLRDGISNGIYFYEVRSYGELIGSGKVYAR
jgi:hypothetical protein